MATCYCCGEEREHLATLMCHDEVAVCKICVSWLWKSFPSMTEATPILLVSDLDQAEAFWTAVGQEVERWQGGSYAFVGDDGQILHLSEDERAGGGAFYLTVNDLGPWHEGWSAGGYQPSPIEDKPWGMREFVVQDPSGNDVRVGQSV